MGRALLIGSSAPMQSGQAPPGIQTVGGRFPMACGVDSRFRGNDQCFERDPIPNDTTTAQRVDILSELS
jgi:hypothetical protein